MSRRSTEGSLALPAVLVFWLAAVAAVGVRGNFPLSDDWVYAHVVRSLTAGRGFDFLPWTGASFVAQALYGAAVCKLAGFSHEVLRASTLAVATLGILFCFALFREVGADRRAAAAAAAAVAFSPLYLNLSFTFMTDVPFAALAVAAAWLYARALRTCARADFLAAGAACAVAFLVRQHALSIAVAAAAAALATGRAGTASRPDEARPVGNAVAALALPTLAAVVYTLWATTSQAAPLAVHNKLAEAAGASVLPAANAGFRALATLGFLFVPWSLTMRPAVRGEERLQWWLAAALAGVAAFVFVREGDLMFYLGNVLGNSSVGALTTRDTLFLALPPEVRPGIVFHVALTVVSLLAAAALVARILASLPLRGAALFCVLALALSGLGTLVQAHYYFDRYTIVLLPLAIASVISVSPPARLGIGFMAALGIVAAYSVAGTHDYLEWNRARWAMLDYFESRGVTADRVDGGVEYNAERFAAALRTAPTDADVRRGQPASVRSWWWVKDDEFVISFRDLEGYSEVSWRLYKAWLPPGEGRVLLLHREAPAAGLPRPDRFYDSVADDAERP